MSTIMRAKLQVSMVQEYHYGENAAKSGENLTMHAVAMYSPGATLVISIANPALWGKFKHGDKFYVDFTPAPEK